MEIFPEIGPLKIFLVPPNSAPGLRPWPYALRMLPEAQLLQGNIGYDDPATYGSSNSITETWYLFMDCDT